MVPIYNPDFNYGEFAAIKEFNFKQQQLITQSIEVQNIVITISKVKDDDFKCLTDMAKAKEGDARAADILKNWIRNRSTLEFIGTWE